LLTPCWAASPSSLGAACPTARGCTNNDVTPRSADEIVSGRDRSPTTTSTPGGAAVGRRGGVASQRADLLAG
jgi:hypothetical protein